LWHRAAGRAAAHGEHEAAGTDCRYFGSGSYITASRRRAGGSAWIALRQWVLPDVTTTAGRASWHRAAGRVAERGEHEAVDTACRHYDSGSHIMASRRRRPGGSAWRASRQRVLPVIATTVGRASRHRAAGRAAAHGGHRGSGHCLTSLRQLVAHRGIVPPGGRQRVESIEAVDTACRHYDSGSHIMASRRRRPGGSARRA